MLKDTGDTGIVRQQNTTLGNEGMIVGLSRHWRQQDLKRLLCCGVILEPERAKL
jgi:hypothetical protein